MGMGMGRMTTMRDAPTDAPVAVGWACGPLTTAADGAVSFTVNQPATTYKSGGKTVIKPATTHTRVFDAAGGMTVVR